jgi:hypothetical protein
VVRSEDKHTYSGHARSSKDTWYAAVAVPHTKSDDATGKAAVSSMQTFIATLVTGLDWPTLSAAVWKTMM